MSGRSNARDHVALAHQYAEQVLSGQVIACQWIKAACKRHLVDLQASEHGQSPWVFDGERGARVCKFAEKLPHIKGRWKSKNITLEHWQCFFLVVLFGWHNRETGLRRFRKALLVVARKNAKTTLAAIILLYLLALDGEPGAEVFSAATTRDQARLSWEVAQRMVQRSPGLQEYWGIQALAHSITVESNAACFKPLSRDADSLEGLNPHGWVTDELHAHKTREVFDVLDEATGARTQPLGVIISTEGDNAVGVFAEQVAYGQNILKGTHQDDSYFPLIYTLDPEDDWTDEEVWQKANPNLYVANAFGIRPLLEDMRVRFRQAEKNPASQSSFLTKRCNVRVGAGNAYFNLLAWQNLCFDSALKLDDFRGKQCYLGLDLASKWDLCAKLYLFPEPNRVVVFGRYYLPSDAADRGNPNYDLYRGWADSGKLILTEGNITDYDRIEADLLQDQYDFRLLGVGYDPHEATQLVTHLTEKQKPLPMIEVAQNVRQMSEPMQELGARILSGRIQHDGDPVLMWALGNVQAKIDKNENVYPFKARAENKIDPAVAAIIAMNLLIRNANVHKPSVYSKAATAII